MTGNNWPYPPVPGEGTNAVGVGAVGVAPIGSLPAFSWRASVQSEYANSDALTALLQSFAEAAGQTQNFDAFYDQMLNLNTASGYGLDCWGRIVGVNRVLQVANTQYFGFAEAGDALPLGDARFQGWTAYFGFAEAGDASPFNQAPFGAQKIWAGVDPQGGGGQFYSGGMLTSNYAMSDQTYRQVIYAKAEANICNGSIPAINKILLSLFPGRGNCYVLEGTLPQFFGFAEAGDAQPFNQAPMYSGQPISRVSITYVFRFSLSPVENAIVAQSGVLPKPIGVPSSIAILP
jgi:hypothetical protein